MLLALVNAGSPRTVRALIDTLAEPMGRADADAAMYRLTSGGMAYVTDDSPRRYMSTAKGRARALELEGQGATF